MSSGDSRSPHFFPPPKKPFTIPSLVPTNCVQLCIANIQHVIFLPHELFYFGSVAEDKLVDYASADLPMACKIRHLNLTIKLLVLVAQLYRTKY